MPELRLHRTDDTLTITFGQYSSTALWSQIAFTEQSEQHVHDDAISYGHKLFEQISQHTSLSSVLTTLSVNERLLLTADQPEVAAVPWEYLRTLDNSLLAARLNVVRSIPEAEQRKQVTPGQLLEIIAVSVSSVDQTLNLNTEREWQRLTYAVKDSEKALKLTRVRPPTLSQMERTFKKQGTNIVHFMGHGSTSNGKSSLIFEDDLGRAQPVESTRFADSLNNSVFLVVLNSCMTAVVASTEFGNIARAVVSRGIPYALGMQFVLPDDGALEISKDLYDFLLQGHSVEEAVRLTRRALEDNKKLRYAAWLAGIPALYTNQQEPAPPIQLESGRARIQPDPQELAERCDLSALPKAEHFVGRSKETSAVLRTLLAQSAKGFVVLHGLGGIGKTTLARSVAERVSYRYNDYVFAYSFETFATFDDQGRAMVNETFAERFCTQLLRFYQRDPAQYLTTSELQNAILQRRRHHRALLVLDNMETLISSQMQDENEHAKNLAGFLSRLMKEGSDPILLTSRDMPPSDWGDCHEIVISGLDDIAGSDLFLTLLPTKRKEFASAKARFDLTRRVQGHPLSIRLLAGHFAQDTSISLATFLTTIENELTQAEAKTPTSLEDPKRQATLYACMNYSVKRLSSEQKNILHAISIFQAPFPSQYAQDILKVEEVTKEQATKREEEITKCLQDLVRLGLLETATETFAEGELELLELHPMLRWYIQHSMPALDSILQERYGLIYTRLARQAYRTQGGYDQSALIRYLIRQSLPDCEAALQYLSPQYKSSLAYHLTKPYERMGQNQRVIALYELALELYKQLDDVRNVALVQGEMAEVLVEEGKVEEAMQLYEQSLQAKRKLDDTLGIAVIQNAMAFALVDQGRIEEAMKLYEQSLQAKKELDDVRGVAVTQGAMADALVQQGQLKKAMKLYEESLQTYQDTTDVRGIAMTQGAMADVLARQGQIREAMKLYEESLQTKRELDDVPSIAITMGAIADLLVHQGRVEEAMQLYEQSLQIKKKLSDVRGIAVTRGAIADILVDQGRLSQAMRLYELALETKQKLNDIRGIAITQGKIAHVLVQQGQLEGALQLYEQSLQTTEELGNVSEVAVTQVAIADVLVQQGQVQKAIQLYEQSLQTMEDLGDVLSASLTKTNLSQVLLQEGKTIRSLSMIWEAHSNLSKRGYLYNVQQVQDILVSIKKTFLYNEQFEAIWIQAISDPQPSWLSEIQLSSSAEGDKGKVLAETVQAVRAFANAPNLDAARHVVESSQALLFQPAIEQILESNIVRAREKADEEWAQQLETRLKILRMCKCDGIEAAFEQTTRRQPEKASSLLESELILHSMKALLNEPMERVAYGQYLAAQVALTTDEQLKELLKTIQLSLFGNDLAQLGGELEGVYQQAWEAIVAGVREGKAY